MVTKCANIHKYPVIKLQVAGYWLEMDPKDYFLDVDPEHSGHLSKNCFIGFQETTQPFILVGDTLFRGYYTIFEDKSARIGFAPHATSTKERVTFDVAIPATALNDMGHHW